MIKRYDLRTEYRSGFLGDGESAVTDMVPDERGWWVRYSSHESAIAAAVAAERERAEKIVKWLKARHDEISRKNHRWIKVDSFGIGDAIDEGLDLIRKGGAE